MGEVERYPNGTFCWIDLGTDDAPAAKASIDADTAATKARQLGGVVVLPPMDVPVGRFTVVADPQGAVLSAAAVPCGRARGVDGS